MHWFIDPIKNHYADFSGRATRQEYWMFFLFNILIGIPLGIVFVIAPLVAILLYCFYVIALIIPGIAISIRRLHDTGRSGWWLLLSLVPWVGGIIVFVFYCLPSQKGSNTYGPNKYEGGIAFNSAPAQTVMTPTMSVQASSVAAEPAILNTVAPTVSIADNTETPVVGYGNYKKEE